VWVYLGRGVATNALPRDDTLPYFLSSEWDKHEPCATTVHE